jgi:PKHD-type hydroxylase
MGLIMTETEIQTTIEPMTPKRFSLVIERLVREKELNYMDAILYYCEEHQLEPEDIRKYVSRTLKEKVEVTAKEHRSSSISWLKRDDTTEFIYSKVLQLIYMENVNNKWNFDYDAIEDLQFTRYDKSQHYNWHADQKSTVYHDEELSGKIRKISFSIILNDDYEGGDFQFEVGAPYEEDRIITLTPSKGCAIVFPSFKFHRVTPVTKGVRYSLVGWICGKPFV